MPVGKGSIERAVKAKNAAEAKVTTAAEKKTPAKKPAAKKPAAKKAPTKKAAEPVVQETVIAATSPEVMEMVTGKRQEKPVRVGEPMPEWLL